MKKIKTFILRHFEGALISLIFIGIFAIAFLVYSDFAFLNFFFLPVILAGYYLGKKRAVLSGLLCILTVILYLIFRNLFSESQDLFTFERTLNLLTWGGFLILTAAIVGNLSEQREHKMRNLRRAYTGVIEILFKYLECADEVRPCSLRTSLMAGKIAAAVGLDMREVENIKSAAMLRDAEDLRANIHLFEEVSGFMAADGAAFDVPLSDREKVMLKATASLLKEVGPLLENYYRHYVEEGNLLDKDLKSIPIGSSIIALAGIYDKIENGAPPHLNMKEFNSLPNLMTLSDRTFPSEVLQALQSVVSSF